MSDRLAAPSLYINRELSWLEFNAHVLHEAFDARNPLLERLKFLAIFSTNLDEFYMVRVAGLRRQLAAGVMVTGPDGLAPAEQLAAIRRRVDELLVLQRRCLFDELLPALAERGVRLVGVDQLDARERGEVDAFFESTVFPVLTPVAIGPGHPLAISNLSLSLAVQVRDPGTGARHVARVKVPKSLPRWIPTGHAHRFVPLEQVIGAHLDALFPGMEPVGWAAFRVTRNSDIDLTMAEESEDLLETIAEQVFRRRFGEVVRLEVQEDTPEAVRSLLLDELCDAGGPGAAALPACDVHEAAPLLELGDLMEIASLDIPALRDRPIAPVVPAPFRDVGDDELFAALRAGDVLVHHPFESFQGSVERFLEVAARDPDVLALKLTLYRTSGDTAIVRALIDAAERGKQVAVLVELQARFDEANNITWARRLESAGVHVVYGLGSIKTHAKLALVVRREPEGIRRYVHVGTGNYNSRTARQYTDLGLFSADPRLGADLSDLFNVLTGYSRQQTYRRLIVAPVNMRERFVALVEREAAHARASHPARIVAKLNALVDADLIRALYRASMAGVDIDLIVRGICCLRPGVPGVSERIRVMSVVGRFLEHSRIWYFANAGDEEMYVGSSDWMPRNFDRRVEAVAPVEAPALRERLRSLLATYLLDDRMAWDLDADGRYHARAAAGEPRAAQAICLAEPWGRTPVPPAEIVAPVCTARVPAADARGGARVSPPTSQRAGGRPGGA